MAVSNEILISKLLNLSKTFTGSIRALCEQQNEKVLRFDDDMILGVLRRWEQEAGKEEEEESVSEPDNSSTTSLITLGATNALERYQIIVGRVWEETDVILSCIRKIRDLVEFGRVQHYSDFDDDDSEEDAIERDEVMKKSLYSRLLFHAHGLVTVLGECLECVSGIQRLVSTSKTQRKSMENTRDEFFLNGTATAFDNNEYEGDGCRSPSIVSLSMEEPRPVRHLDPALMRKLKRKTKFKTITEKMRQSFSDFAKRSTNSLLSVFPPLGDGTNEGFHWDSYSDGEYYSEEWVGTEFGGSFLGDEDSFFRTMSPPESPIFKSEKFYSRHRRLSSKDSSSVPDQYWPGSIRLGFSDDGMSPTTSSHPITPLSPPPSLDPTVGYFSGAVVGGASMARRTSSERTPNTIASRFHISSPTNGPSMNKKSLESLRESFGMTRQLPVEGDSIMGPSLPTSPTRPEGKEKRQSLLFRRKSIQAPSFTGVSISTPVPVASRPLSVYSSSGESQTPSRNNYRVRPPRPPNSLPPMPPSPTQRDSLENSFGSESAGSPSVYASYQPRQSNRTSSYLATRSISPQQSSPLILNSPFTRKTSIRMGMDRNRYSVRMPEDDQSDQLMSFITDNHSSAHGSNGINNSPRNSNFSGSFWRRRSYNDAVEKDWQSLLQESFVPSISGASDISTPSTPSGRLEKRSTVGLDSSSSPRSSAQLASFEFLIPFFSREGNSVSSSASSRQGSRPGSGSLLSRSGSERMMMLGNNRRHSSPLTLGAERALADALNPRLSVSSQQSQSSTDSQPHQPQQQGSTNRSSDQKMPTVDEKKSHSAPHQRQNQDVGSTVKSRLETDPLSIPPRPKSTYRKESQESTASSNSSDGTRYHAPYVSGKTMAGVPMESNSNYREPGSVDRRGIPIDLDRKPVVSPRFGDMKKAWEILNLDVKRINQYSHLRAYAKAQTAQNNLWALRHPNALQSTTSPSVLHIGENGTHVLVMEMFAGHLQVVAGLLEKLIERLADENAQDAEYVSCFLLSHSFFIDSEDLLDRLMARFHIQPRQGEIIYFEKWQTVIQVKILCVLQRWITIQYEDFELNPNLLKTLKKFLEVDVRESGFVMEAECIEKNVSIKNLSPIKNCSVIMEQGRFCLQRSRTRKVSLTRSLNRTGSGSPPSQMSTLEPALPSPTEQLIEYGPTPELAASSPILQLNGQDLARYLTLADMKAFRSITVFELMSGWWKRRQAAENRRSSVGDGDDGAEPKSPSGLNVAGIDGAEDGAIEAFTRRANMLSYWVAHEIVSTAGSKARKQLIKKFIEVAKICRTLNNLHTAMFIVSALTSKPVRRLSSTWKLVSNRDMETLRGLEALMDPSGNMRSYRQAIADAEAPIIPFLPILLKDITFILDGNPTMITSKTNLPNQVDPVSTSSPVSAPLPIPATSADTTTDNETATISSSTTETATTTPKDNGAPLVNFDKFRRLTQYVENAVDMAKSVDYSFEHQLLRQARVFRPTSPSLYGETDSLHGSSGGTSSLLGGRSGSNHGNSHGNGNHPAPDGSRGALDHISEIVERRLVKASGLYGVHQRVIQVEFVTRAPSSKSSVGSSSLPWKAAGGDHHSGGGGSNIGSIHGSMVGYGSGRSVGDTVIRAVQGEEEYLMGLSRMCEPVR
ncbi:hypothetical protein BGX23_007580 [Mortierella sp. AD031]|nr:hypothetical protein BGX23_007580 [Mortierella sp. AD031]